MKMPRALPSEYLAYASLTEEEAKTKRCQEGFGAPLNHVPALYPTGERSAETDLAVHVAPVHCIGSACMAWRWNGDSPEFFGSGPEDNLNSDARRGYCGKAGKP